MFFFINNFFITNFKKNPNTHISNIAGIMSILKKTEYTVGLLGKIASNNLTDLFAECLGWPER
jgi:hypothetical protein